MDRSIDKYWLLIESYVYMESSKDKVFLYNTLDASYVETESKEVIRVVERLLAQSSKYCILIDNNDLSKIRDFVDEIRLKYIGDIICVSHSAVKPIQVYPILNLQNRNKVLDISTINLLENLHEINLYINGSCSKSCDFCSNAFKKFLSCFKSKDNEMSLKLIERIFNMIESSSVYKINVLGGDIFEYTEFSQLLELSLSLKERIVFNFNILNLPEDESVFTKSDYNWNVIIDFNNDINKIEYLLIRVLGLKLNMHFMFIVRSKIQYAYVQQIIEEYCTIDYEIKPYYDFDNIDFFKEYVFLNKEDIFNKPISIQEIFRNQVINSNFFGKIGVLCNGDAYSDFCNASFGNLNNDNIIDCIENEFLNKYSWFRTRNQGKCRFCFYRYLCPPISNYEIVIGRDNLCNVYD
ncbi:MAG: TIGR04150 pseudo-rSAM protein [Paludibacter sp.]|nr:TIGR04150 pseudo-rSAM protein [Paludibacter sp.]